MHLMSVPSMETETGELQLETGSFFAWKPGVSKDEMLQANISTTIPEGASHFLVYSSNSFGEMTSPVSSPISDMYVWN